MARTGQLFWGILVLLMVKEMRLRVARLVCYIRAGKEPVRKAAEFLYLAKVK